MSSKRLSLDGGFYVPAVLAIITLVYLVSAMQIGTPMKDGNMTPSFFPITAAAIMLIALVCAMVQEIRRARSIDTEKKGEASGSEEGEKEGKNAAGISLGAICVALLTAGYLLAFDLIGYFVSTFLYVLLLMFQFGSFSVKSLPMKLIATFIVTGAGFLLFEVFFQVRLPTLWG
ncbi:tripartite tricarboxylate transporter TctB family protein [Halomonas elongata]|uniref:Tripartite tricarboxylate transporter TctB family protein n=1 Tax=Halomonas elongata (strain ATCC 33173 / DSM 2581 / NBRC 15536 / NCIMB 2198 / 1H9) TaxID=768066 RepID=A0ABZ0T566_HALED|nr:tripartite tricarboxylate transporter TctB family protein [Halomonas elongata]WBF16916.1 tripartite tricarboxylate transporter TctB family protein [Halomonas elongata]WPU45747.1 tripartite tricarboxylate transporter TctB family protein [Halomonas elongata DSM 2581]